MVVIDYEFGRKQEDFSYEPDFSDYRRHVEKSPKSVLELVKDIYDEDEKIRNWLHKDYSIDNVDQLEIDSDEGRDLVYLIMSEADDDLIYELREEEVKDFFINDAYEEWEDYKAYTTNPLKYYGISERDLL